MLGDKLVVKSYVVINEGCPLAYSFEGPEHVTFACGQPSGAFEIVFDFEALRAMVALACDALSQADSTTT